MDQQITVQKCAKRAPTNCARHRHSCQYRRSPSGSMPPPEGLQRAPTPPSRRHWGQARRPPGFHATWARANMGHPQPLSESRAIGAPRSLPAIPAPTPHPQRAERSQGRRPKLFAGLRQRALGDHARQNHAAPKGAEKLIQADLLRSAADHLEQECDQDIRAEAAFAGEGRRADGLTG